MPTNEPSSVIPAQLSFLTIYNPSLGQTDETLHEQIVFYSSKSSRLRHSRSTQRDNGDDSQREDENERLRQVGLAQGMVSFAKNFSNGEPVDSVETEKSRVILHELEASWWILASIDLTRLPSDHFSSSASPSNPSTNPRVGYSSREVSPPYLVRQHLVRAHSIFLLHHGPSLDALYCRLSRTAFCSVLDRFWTRYIWNWDVILNGNPAVDIFNGIKLARSGELGIGVGEEEWGSGEREVLEDFVGRTDGLVDLVVSRFGDGPEHRAEKTPLKSTTDKSPVVKEQLWLGCGMCPRPSDGVIFSGIGAICRSSLTHVSQWMEWIYRHGEDTYGVREDPESIRRRKRRKIHAYGGSSGNNYQPKSALKPKLPPLDPSGSRSLLPGIPPPLVSSSEALSKPAAAKIDPQESSRRTREITTYPEGKSTDPLAFGTETFMKLLTLGYGSSWGGSPKNTPSHPRVTLLRHAVNINPGDNKESNQISTVVDSASEPSSVERVTAIPRHDKSAARFMIGLRNDLENEDTDDEDIGCSDPRQNHEGRGIGDSRIMMRMLTLRLRETVSGDPNKDIHSIDRFKKLQVVIYLHQPFMFTFLFEPQAPVLSSPTFYRSIHHQLGPLQKPLLSSTSPANASKRTSLPETYQSSKTKDPDQQQPLYDLIYDPSNNTIHTSLPNIPEPATSVEGIRFPDDSIHPQWTRLEALNVHAQVLNTYIETRSRLSEVERTCKTSRGWWVVWMRLANVSLQGDAHGKDKQAPQSDLYSMATREPREAFLIRKARDYSPQKGRRSASGTRFFGNIGGKLTGSQSDPADGGGSGIEAGKLAEGVGLDARRYIEALLSLNR